MKIQFRDYLDTRKSLTHIVMENVEPFVDTIKDGSEYQTTGFLDIELKINGVEVNPEEYFKRVDEYIIKANQQFEVWKAKWISKNSDASKKEKLIKEFQKANQMLQNINDKLTN